MTIRQLDRTGPRAYSHAVIAVLMVHLCLAVPRDAAAQGADGAFADPISSRDLMRYAQRLELSEQQRTAMESIHDAYKRDFLTLRDGPIAEFLEETRAYHDSMPQRETVETFIRRMRELQGRIELLDERLFDQLQPMLTDRQAALLPRLRMARERDRYFARDQLWAGSRKPVDLSRLVTLDGLPAETARTADRMLAEYEMALTVRMRQRDRASTRVFLDIIDGIEGLGYQDLTEEDLADPEVAQEVMAAVQGVMASAAEKANRIIEDIRRLNEATVARIGEVLPSGDARDLRFAFYRQAYPDTSSIIRIVEQNDYERSLEVEDLTEAQRADLESACQSFFTRIDTLVRRIAELSRERQRQQNGTPFPGDPESWQAYRRQVETLETKATVLVNDMTEQVRKIAGPDWLARAKTRDRRPPPGPPREQPPEPIDHDAAELRWFVDAFVPGPIDRRELTRFRERLDLDDARFTVLEELHNEYIERYGQLEIMEALKEANRTLWTIDPDNGRTIGPPDKAVDELIALRRRAFEMIVALDDRFFEEISIAVADESKRSAVERLRSLRLRQLYASAGRAASTGRAGEAVDPVDVLSRLELTTADWRQVAPILDEYEAGALPALQTLFDARLAFDRASNEWRRLVFSVSAEQRMSAGVQGEYGRIMNGPSRQVGAAVRAIETLNDATIDRLVTALPPAAAAELRRTYNIEAYSEIYRDRFAVHRPLASALEMEDLTTAQHRALSDLAASYRPQYEALSHRLVEIERLGIPNGIEADGHEWQAFLERRDEAERIRFERSELNFRTNSRIRAILSESQIARIGGLPDPHEGLEDDEAIW
jgi:hypothetical protein